MPALTTRISRITFGTLLLFATFNAYAHEGESHEPAGVWRDWPLEPGVLIPLLVSGWLYLRGISRLWQNHIGRGIRRWEAAAFASGWFALFIALASPLHPLGGLLFSAHMTQHEILMLIAAPLLVLGQPLLAFLKAIPSRTANRLVTCARVRPFRATWRWLLNPYVAWVIHALALWIWHLPALFQATLESETIHALQHASFFFSALLFWEAVTREHHRFVSHGLAVLYLFTTAMHSGLLGALITFANTPLYPIYNHRTQSLGLTPLEDQQLGGLIMWIPAGLVYVIAGLAFFAGWLREAEKRTEGRFGPGHCRVQNGELAGGPKAH